MTHEEQERLMWKLMVDMVSRDIERLMSADWTDVGALQVAAERRKLRARRTARTRKPPRGGVQ